MLPTLPRVENDQTYNLHFRALRGRGFPDVLRF